MELPGFELLEQLGSGGMATVWKARQISLDRTVAIKILSARLARTQADADRFQTEAQSAARLKHHGIVQVYDASVHEGVYYFVMEYVAGYSVGDWIRRKEMVPEADALLTAEYVADALRYAWETQKIVHCDIKPDNIMIDADGTVKVADLGLARSIGVAGSAQEDEEIMGTPNYMAPEQIEGDPDIDCRTDIYSLGAALYHMVTGHMMFQESDTLEVMDKQLTARMPDPLEINPELSMSMCWLIEKMLCRDRNDRQPDWKTVLLDIAQVKRDAMLASAEPPPGASVVERSASRTRPKRRFSLGKRVPAFVWVAVIVLAVIGVGIEVVRILLPTRPPDPGPSTNISIRLPDPPGGKLAAVEEAYKLAARWADEHPERYDEAIARFEAVGIQAAGTEYETVVEQRISNLRERKRESVMLAWNGLRAQEDALTNDDRYDEALALYTDYDGPFGDDLADECERRAEKIREMRDAFNAARNRTSVDAEKKMARVVTDLAAALAGGGMDAAQEVINDAMTDSELSSRQDLWSLQYALSNAKDLDQNVLSDIRTHEGDTITLRTHDGAITLRIIRVSADRIFGEQRQNGSVKQVELTVSDLSVRETLHRFGSDDNPAVALRKGVLASQATSYTYAKKYFRKVTPQLSRALVAEVEKLEKAQRNRSAEESLARLMRSVGIQVEEYDEKEWMAAISRKKIPGSELSELRRRVQLCRDRHGDTDFGRKAEPVLKALAGY